MDASVVTAKSIADAISGYRLQDLANACRLTGWPKCHPPSLAKAAAGETTLGFDHAAALADALQVTLDSLREGHPKMAVRSTRVRHFDPNRVRAARGTMSLASLATACKAAGWEGCHAESLRKIELGTSTPSIRRACALVAALGTTLEAIRML
jgi:hypothetical protein